MSAGLWVRDSAGVSRKLKKLYTNVGGVTRELKELWVRDGGGVARKIFSSAIICTLDHYTIDNAVDGVYFQPARPSFDVYPQTELTLHKPASATYYYTCSAPVRVEDGYNAGVQIESGDPDEQYYEIVAALTLYNPDGNIIGTVNWSSPTDGILTHHIDAGYVSTASIKINMNPARTTSTPAVNVLNGDVSGFIKNQSQFIEIKNGGEFSPE